MRATALAYGLAALLVSHAATAQPTTAPTPPTQPAPPGPTPATNPPPATLPPPPSVVEEDAPVVSAAPATPATTAPLDRPGSTRAAASSGGNSERQDSATLAPVLFAPSGPAFDAIGATPTTIARPTTIQSMGAALLSYIDGNGRVNAGIAVEAAPLWLLFGDEITLKGWRSSYGDRALSRLSLSFASSVNATGLTEISQGLRFVIADDMDPRWDAELEQCVGKALQASLPDRDGGALPVDPGDRPPIVKDASVQECQDAAEARADERLAGKSAAAFSTAITQVQDQDGDASFGKYFAWLSGLANLGKGARWLSLLGSARYVFNHPGHELDLAARVRAGNSRLGIAVDVGWLPRTNASGDLRPETGILGLNGEVRVSKSLWLSATAGGRFGAHSGNAPNLFSVLHFKYATESAASIAPIQPPP